MKLKVFGLTLLVRATKPYPNGSQQRRCIVATSSQKEAARLFDVTLGYLRGYGCETGNAKELEIALGQPGAVFWQEDYKDVWHKLEERAGK